MTTSRDFSGGGNAALLVHEHVSRFVLPNGLTLLVRRDASAPVVGLYTHVKAGYFDEPDDRVGIAHVLEHMYFKGTPMRGVGAIARETKLAGGWLNAHTIYDHTAYVAVVPNDAFERALDIQFDAYANSLIEASELARELEVIVQEAQRKRDSPGAVTVESLFALLHDRHRIRRWRIGEPDELRTFSREMLLDFYRTWYVPSNTVIAIVGDVDPDTVHAAVAARYGALPSAAPTREPAPVESGKPGVRVRELTGDIAQAHIAFGWRTPPLHHTDSPALELAGTILGSGRASRCYRAVREQQMATGVSSYAYTSGDVGVFVVHAETPAATLRAAALATWREVQAARTFGVRAEELARAKSVLEARWLRRLESMDGQAAYLAAWEAEGDLSMGAQYYNRLMQCTVEDVQAALERHLDPSQVSVMVYRPLGSVSLPSDAESLRSWLATVEGLESSVTSVSGAADHDSHARDLVGTMTNERSSFEASALPTSAQPTAERIVGDVHVFRTPGNVPVLVRARPGTPIVNLGVFLRGGAVAEPEALEGVARIAAQSALKGTRSRSSAGIALAAESLGGSISVSAGLESQGWSLSVPVRHFDAALELLADVIQHPVFDASAVDTELQLALAEVQRLRDDMYRWPMRLAARAAHAGHPYARSVLGTETSLAAITTADVIAQHQRALRHGACVIGVVGDIDASHVAMRIGQCFGELVSGDDQELSRPHWPSDFLSSEDAREKKQTALMMLFQGPSRRDPERYAARVLSAVASGLGGRFFDELRDKLSLAYTVAAYPIERRVDGMFAAYIATAPAREPEARAGLLREFAKLRETQVHEEEIERARRYLVGTHAISQQSGGALLGDMIDAWLFGDGLEELGEYTTRIAAVTPAEILTLAQRYFDPARRVEGVVRGVNAVDDAAS